MTYPHQYNCTPIQAAALLGQAMAQGHKCPCCGATALEPSAWTGCDMGAQGCEHNHADDHCLNKHKHDGQYGCGLWQHWFTLCCATADVAEILLRCVIEPDVCDII